MLLEFYSQINKICDNYEYLIADKPWFCHISVKPFLLLSIVVPYTKKKMFEESGLMFAIIVKWPIVYSILHQQKKKYIWCLYNFWFDCTNVM